MLSEGTVVVRARGGGALMDRAWVGVDVGKEFHWAHVLDNSGREILSRKLENDEVDISKLIYELLCLAGEIV